MSQNLITSMMSPHSDWPPPSYSCVSDRGGADGHELHAMRSSDVEVQDPTGTEEALEDVRDAEVSVMQKFRDWWTPPWEWDRGKWFEALSNLGCGVLMLVFGALVAGILSVIAILLVGLIVGVFNIAKSVVAYIGSGGQE